MKQKEIQIAQFRRRFGERISENILSLFYDSYSDAIESNIGKELISDVLHAMNILIKEIAGGNKEKIPELSKFKEIASKWNGIIKKSKQQLNDDYLEKLPTEKEETALIHYYRKKGTDAISRLINLDRFYYAYKSELGETLQEDIEKNINEGITSIWKGSVNGELTNYNAYTVIKSNWNIRMANREKTRQELKGLTGESNEGKYKRKN